MDQQLNKLHEDLLYALYQNHFLKKRVSSIEFLTVEFDKNYSFSNVLNFSLVLSLAKGQQIVWRNKDTDSFLESLRIFDQANMASEDWVFLEDSLLELKSDVSLLEETIGNIISEYYKVKFHPCYFLPVSGTFNFHKDTEEVSYGDIDPIESWSMAWNEFVNKKQNYFLFLGFKDNLTALKEMRFLDLKEERLAEAHDLSVIRLILTVKYNGETYKIQHCMVDGNASIETHFFVEGECHFDFDENDFVTTGDKLSGIFGIPYENGFDFEQQLRSFLARDSKTYSDSLAFFAESRGTQLREEFQNRVGKSIVGIETENGETLFILSDGTKLKER